MKSEQHAPVEARQGRPGRPALRVLVGSLILVVLVAIGLFVFGPMFAE